MVAIENTELDIVQVRIQAAVLPEDIFGYVEPDAAHRVFRRLQKACHSDRHPEAADLATQVTTGLNVWWAKAQKRIALNLYGTTKPDAAPVTLTSKTGEYTIDGTVWRAGDLADLYRTSDGLIVKVGRGAADSDLLHNEAATLRKLRADPAQAEYHLFFPNLVDSFDAMIGGVRRTVNVLQMPDDLYSLDEVMAQHHGALNAKHMAWIWRRVLKALGFADKLGIVHGAVLPQHVLISEQHALVLVDWAYSVKSGAPLKAIPSPSARDYYPADVFTKAPSSGTLDTRMGAFSMVRLMGGDLQTGALPDEVPLRIRRYFQTWWRHPDLGVADAWQLNREFTELIDALWRREFQPISLART